MDIFVSYTEADGPWAFWIGKALQTLGHVPHIHAWEISGGDDIPKWMEERLKGADRVICIISQKYLTKDYSGWERNAAEWAAASSRPNFVLPVLVEDCELPVLLAPIKRCDLFKAGSDEGAARSMLTAFLTQAKAPTDPVRFPGAPKPVVEAVNAPDTAPFPVGRVEVGAITTGIESLTSQADVNPEVRNRVQKDRDKLDRLKVRIDLMSNLKELHDFLHDLQIQVYPQIIDYLEVLETDLGAKFGLVQILEQLKEACKRARKAAGRLPDEDPDRDALWLSDIEQVLPALQAAADARDGHDARQATMPFRTLWVTQLKIDDRLHSLAKSLPFGVLRKLLEDVCEMAAKGETFERWKKAQESLQIQQTELYAMVEEHHAWQNLEPNLELADQSIKKDSVVSFQLLWPDLTVSVNSIAAKYPDTQWVKQSHDLSAMVDIALAQSNIKKAREFFRYFRNNSLQHFWALDKQLKEKCEEISAIREPLERLLEAAKP